MAKRPKPADNGKADSLPEPTIASPAIPPPDYEVGYRRPPKATQFKKGQPRPPRKHKPESEPGLAEYIAEELAQPMSFTDEEGREQRYPKGKVLAKTAVNKAIKTGELRGIKDYVPKPKQDTEEKFTDADLANIARFLARWQAEEGRDL